MKFSELLLEYLQLRDEECNDTGNGPIMRYYERRTQMSELLAEMDNIMEKK